MKEDKKKLIIRLSSFGDLVLMSAALDKQKPQSFDLITLKEYEDLFSGHPALSKIWIFDKKKGLVEWKNLLQLVFKQNYDEIYDFHKSLRTFYAFLLDFFIIRSKAKWIFISKYKIKKNLFYILKSLYPKALRPPAWWKVYVQNSHSISSSTDGRPQLRHLLKRELVVENERIKKNEVLVIKKNKKLMAIMPSSRWQGKKWSLEKFIEVIRFSNHFPVILGTPNDFESVLLCEILEREGLPFYSLVGHFSFPFTAQVLIECDFIISGDTGLTHFAEALGVPAWVLFGPTHPDAGFGPWMKSSKIFHSQLWCSPCGKDGRFCFRPGSQKYLCMQKISSAQVLSELQKQEHQKIESHL